MAKRDRKGLGDEISLGLIEAMKNKGLNQTEIANELGCTRANISYHVRYHGGRLTPKQQLLEDHFPIQVNRARSQTAPFRALRYHAEWLATNGIGMNAEKIQRLRSFYKKLRDGNLVLEYDPDIPPIEGVSKTGGFAYRKRLPKDKDMLIRKNEYTDITEYGEILWRFPPVEP